MFDCLGLETMKAVVAVCQNESCFLTLVCCQYLKSTGRFSVRKIKTKCLT